MIQNITVAGMPRSPKAHGIPLTESGRYKMEGNKYMDLIMEAKRKSPGVGLGMLNIYFEDTKLKVHESSIWNEARATLEERKRTWQSRRYTIIGDGLAPLIDTMARGNLPAPFVKIPKSPTSTTKVTDTMDAITPLERTSSPVGV